MKNFTSNKVAGFIAGLVLAFALGILIMSPPMAKQAFGQVGITGFSFVLPPGAPPDPCASLGTAKLSTTIGVASSTTTELVAATANKTVFVCLVNGSLSGTTPTFTMLTGTKVSTACDTTPSNRSGAYLPTTGAMVNIGSGASTAFKSILGGEICVTTGATTNYNGLIDYVVQ